MIINDLPYDITDNLKFSYPADTDKTEQIFDLIRKRFEDLNFFFHYLLANTERLDYSPVELENYYYAMCIVQTAYDLGRTDGVEDQTILVNATLGDDSWLSNAFKTMSDGDKKQ